jgi:hypothetical protein
VSAVNKHWIFQSLFKLILGFRFVNIKAYEDRGPENNSQCFLLQNE